jgi:hypothetical protein
VQDRDNGRELAGFGEHLAGDGLNRNVRQRIGIGEADLATTNLARAGHAEQQPGDERREVRVVGLHGALRGLGRIGRDGEHLLGRRVHQHRAAVRVGHDNRIGDRVDDQVQPIPLRARRRLRHAELLVVFLDLLRGAAQVRDVSQHRDDAGPFARIFDGGGEDFEQQVRTVARVHEEQLAGLGIGMHDGRPR